MLRKTLLPLIFILLSWGFWVSPDFNSITAGVAIFLFGMLSLETGFKVFTGGTLERILTTMTNTRFKSLMLGVISTSVLQSSSLVSVIIISFLSAGLIGLSQAVGIIFGSNIGSTAGAWLIAGFGLKVKISTYALPMLVFGILLIYQKSKSLIGMGYILMGLGFLFLGIHYMKEGFEAFKDTIDLTEFAIIGFKGLLFYTFLGTVATVVMQSSQATLIITITALATSQVSYDNALALVIGANIGTTVTAILGAINANEKGKQLAAAHLIFNLVTGIVAIAFMSYLLLVVDIISLTIGIDADNYTLKLAVFHTVFNILGVMLLYPVMDRFVLMLQRLFPAKNKSRIKPRFLDESTIGYADTAIEALRNESLHLWDNSIEIIAHGLNLPRTALVSEQDDLKQLVKAHQVNNKFDINRYYNLKIKNLYAEIVDYISRASISCDLQQSGDIHWLRKADQDMVDAIKDLRKLRKNLTKFSLSHNKTIKNQYNLIRIQLVQLIRGLEAIRMADDSDIPSLMIDQLKVESDLEYTQQNKSISELIRQQKITTDMATSLLNDQVHLYNMSRRLVEMGQTLFVDQAKQSDMTDISIQLDEAELKTILNRSSGDKDG